MKSIALITFAAGSLMSIDANALNENDCIRLAITAHDAVEAKAEGVEMPLYLLQVGGSQTLYGDKAVMAAEAIVGAYETEWTAEEYGRNVQQACFERVVAEDAAEEEKMRWLYE